MSDFLKALHSGRVLLMDGAMGTQLQCAGIAPGECYELWNLTHPGQVRAIHQAYVDAGADCLLTNTFQANPAALAKFGLHHKLEDIYRDALAIAGSVAGARQFVIGDVGPIENSKEWTEPIDRIAGSLRSADALLFETWSDRFVGIHAQRAGELSGRQVLVSFSYRKQANGGQPCYLLSDGWGPKRIAVWAQQSKVAALGVNCGRDIGLDDIIAIIRQYRSETDLPLFARPNAGTPTRAGDRWLYPCTPAMMAARLPELLETGVAMVGGCCGTTPEHIAALRPIIDEWNG